MLNRRSFVAALSASLTAATATTTAAHSPREAEELLALSDALPARLQAYMVATKLVQTIADTWGAQWPTPDLSNETGIVCYGTGCSTHRDILGYGIETSWGGTDHLRVQDLGTPEYFEASVAKHLAEAERRSKFKSQRGMEQHLKWAKRDEIRISPARAYWAEVDRITKASGIKAAQAAKETAQDALRDSVGQILTFEEQTILGLAIKAQALTAWSEVPLFWQQLNLDAPAWMAGVAATLTRQVGTAKT